MTYLYDINTLSAIRRLLIRDFLPPNSDAQYYCVVSPCMPIRNACLVLKLNMPVFFLSLIDASVRVYEKRTLYADVNYLSEFETSLQLRILMTSLSGPINQTVKSYNLLAIMYEAKLRSSRHLKSNLPSTSRHGINDMCMSFSCSPGPSEAYPGQFAMFTARIQTVMALIFGRHARRI